MKRLWTILLAIVLFAAFVVPAQAAYQDMWAHVYKWTGGYNSDGSPQVTRLTSGVQFKVLQRGQNFDAETLYVYGTMTSLLNPVSTTNFESATVCDDQVKFRVDPTESNDRYVDLLVIDTLGGYTYLYEDFDKYSHAIIIDERPNVVHHGKVWWNGSTTTGLDTGVRFLAGQQILGFRVEVTTALSAETVQFGTTDDVNTAFPVWVKNVTIASTGMVVTTASSAGHRMATAVTAWNSDFYPMGYFMSASASTEALYSAVHSTGGESAQYPYGYIHYWFSRAKRY